MDEIKISAHAKVNFTLSVAARRLDGYHEIDTVMHEISLADTVEIQKSDRISLSVETGEAPWGEENIMVRTAAWFFEETGISGGAALRLWKRIPKEAGLGGGSADAAAVLRGLNRLHGHPFPRAELAKRSAAIGADVPFCVMGGAARCRGIGDIVTPLPAWKGLSLLIVRPSASVSTRAAYAALDQNPTPRKNTAEATEKALRERNFPALAASLSNDFEATLFPQSPILEETSATLRTFGFPALMTGSGSAFFLFVPPEKREDLRSEILRRHPDWFAEAAETIERESEI